MTEFIHTADLQIGKSFARVSDSGKRSRLRQERIDVVRRIGNAVRQKNAGFVLISGDIFDSATPDRSTVSAACEAIGSLGVPVFAIPGNHDHGGDGSIWEQTFFVEEREKLAPKFRILTVQEPVEIDDAVILPCPLCRRHEAMDVTAWLRDRDLWNALPAEKPRIILAHGSTLNFSSTSDGEEGDRISNLIEIGDIDVSLYDYAALGDWHGTKQVGEKAWYSGTPEPDRFGKGDGYSPGNILHVQISGRGRSPSVTPVGTARFGWHELEFLFVGNESIEHLETALDRLVGGRVDMDLLRLTVGGTLGCEGIRLLHSLIERLEARLLRLKLENRVQMMPTEAEMETLTGREGGDPVISAVALNLKEQIDEGDPSSAEIARIALQKLYLIVRREEGRP